MLKFERIDPAFEGMPQVRTAAVSEGRLPLQRVYHWEKARAGEVFLTQPTGGGNVRDFTWAEAMSEARRMAAHLASFGWVPGSRVAIMAKNCAHWILADLATWMAGHVVVPIYPSLASDSVRQILEHAEVKACFIGKLDHPESMQGGIPDGVERIRFENAATSGGALWTDIIAKTSPIAASPTRSGTDLATIVYTSGTTGVAKGVMHDFANLAKAAIPLVEAFEIDENDQFFSYLPLAHAAERWGIESTAIQAGARIAFAESLETFQADLRRTRPTLFIAVPRLWTKFQQGVFGIIPKERLDLMLRTPLLRGVLKKKLLANLGFDRVRYAFSGAAPTPPDLLHWYRELGLELLEVYGMSENFGLSHASLPGRSRVGYVGHPWPGVEVRLAPNGEILTKSPSMMRGYYKEPELTKSVFTEDGFLKTGDVGECDEDGRLKITGRAKEQFKTSKGKYVAPAPIENKIDTHPKIEASCVAGASHPQPFAMVMLPPGAWDACADPRERRAIADSLGQHRETINGGLDPHERLAFLVVVREQWTVDTGFVTPTLKIKRDVIERHYGGWFDGWAHRNETVIWHEG